MPAGALPGPALPSQPGCGLGTLKVFVLLTRQGRGRFAGSLGGVGRVGTPCQQSLLVRPRDEGACQSFATALLPARARTQCSALGP